jgi:hypothetical protein
MDKNLKMRDLSQILIDCKVGLLKIEDAKQEIHKLFKNLFVFKSGYEIGHRKGEAGRLFNEKTIKIDFDNWINTLEK